MPEKIFKAPRISAELKLQEESSPLKLQRPVALCCLTVPPWFDSRRSVGRSSASKLQQKAAQTCPGRVTSQLTSGRQLGRPRGFLLLLSVPPIKRACSPADAAAGSDRLCQSRGQRQFVPVRRRGKSRSHANEMNFVG